MLFDSKCKLLKKNTKTSCATFYYKVTTDFSVFKTEQIVNVYSHTSDALPVWTYTHIAPGNIKRSVHSKLIFQILEDGSQLNYLTVSYITYICTWLFWSKCPLWPVWGVLNLLVTFIKYIVLLLIMQQEVKNTKVVGNTQNTNADGTELRIKPGWSLC